MPADCWRFRTGEGQGLAAPTEGGAAWGCCGSVAAVLSAVLSDLPAFLRIGLSGFHVPVVAAQPDLARARSIAVFGPRRDRRHRRLDCRVPTPPHRRHQPSHVLGLLLAQQRNVGHLRSHREASQPHLMSVLPTGPDCKEIVQINYVDILCGDVVQGDCAETPHWIEGLRPNHHVEVREAVNVDTPQRLRRHHLPGRPLRVGPELLCQGQTVAGRKTNRQQRPWMTVLVAAADGG